MKATRIHFQWSPGFSTASFRVGVSLHSHTLHSREPLDFLYRSASHSRLLRALLRYAERRYQAAHGTPLDLTRGWWTPPLAPLDAYTLESDQIKALGLSPLVSLTDHDNIEAPTSLQAIDATRKVPISIEWTVPIRDTFFHLGVHNLPPLRARSLVMAMQEVARKPNAAFLKEILAALHTNPGTLVVLNHPLWDEKGVGADAHRAALLDLLGQAGPYVHATELNGLRPWKENRQAILLGETWSKPVISGGDRHGFEPNVVLNLTGTSHFAEFATQIRAGHSDVLIGSRYREAYAGGSSRTSSTCSAPAKPRARMERVARPRVLHARRWGSEVVVQDLGSPSAHSGRRLHGSCAWRGGRPSGRLCAAPRGARSKLNLLAKVFH